MKRVLSISILIILFIVGCKKYDFEEIPDYHYLIVSDTYIPWWSGKYWINFSSDYEISYNISVEPLEYCSWVSDFDVRYEKIYIKVDTNDTDKDRACLFVAYSNKYSAADTFKVFQQKGVKLSDSSYSGGSSSISSHQCAARTKKGKRCKRRASKGSIYCWQHGG